MKTGYLIDMDGVLYRENQLIPGAEEFVVALIASGAPFVFLTNNSSPTPEDLSVRLGHLGLPGLSPRHFYTSALNTAEFLSETHPACTVFVIGEGGLLTALNERKIAVNGAQVLLVGVTYKPNIADRRNSPAAPLATRLASWGAELSYHDPFVGEWEIAAGTSVAALRSVEDVYEACSAADIVVLLQPHSEYDLSRLADASTLMLDTRGVVNGSKRVIRL